MLVIEHESSEVDCVAHDLDCVVHASSYGPANRNQLDVARSRSKMRNIVSGFTKQKKKPLCHRAFKGEMNTWDAVEDNMDLLKWKLRKELMSKGETLYQFPLIQQ